MFAQTLTQDVFRQIKELTFDVPYRPETWQRFVNIPEERVKEVLTVLTAFHAVQGLHHYVSTPITSGHRLYEAARIIGSEVAKLKGTEIAKETFQMNISGAKSLLKTLYFFQGDKKIISPAAFDASKLNWGQGEYMFLWLSLISDKVSHIHFDANWEYSNGCIEEFTYAVECNRGLRGKRLHEILFTEEGDRVFSVQEGRHRIELAIRDILRNERIAPVHKSILDRLNNAI